MLIFNIMETLLLLHRVYHPAKPEVQSLYGGARHLITMLVVVVLVLSSNQLQGCPSLPDSPPFTHFGLMQRCGHNYEKGKHLDSIHFIQ